MDRYFHSRCISNRAPGWLQENLAPFVHRTRLNNQYFRCRGILLLQGTFRSRRCIVSEIQMDKSSSNDIDLSLCVLRTWYLSRSRGFDVRSVSIFKSRGYVIVSFQFQQYSPLPSNSNKKTQLVCLRQTSR